MKMKLKSEAGLSIAAVYRSLAGVCTGCANRITVDLASGFACKILNLMGWARILYYYIFTIVLLVLASLSCMVLMS